MSCTYDISSQLLLSHFPVQEGDDTREVLCPNVRQQNCINPVEVADQLPEAGLRVRASIHQHRESINSKEGTIAAASREHVTAGAGELEETHSGRRWQQVKGGRRTNGARDKGCEFPQSLHGRQHLWGVYAQS